MPFPALNPAFERALAAREYTEPTPVQLAVIGAETAGRDMLVSAQTGSGKTVAFGLALAGVLIGEAERFERAAEPLALIIAPTRELAIQVQRELTWLYAETGARIASCVGGMDPRAERDALGAGAHIVVGTPGRLRDHLERGRLVMTKLRAAVLDEADEMLDLGFREDLEFILDATPAERQTLMFSATVPREIEALARRFQRNAIRIETAVRNQQHDDIEYRAIRTTPNSLEPTVVNLLRYFEMRAALVFCATREGVRKMHAGLSRRGFAAVALSGELSQAERSDALQSLRDGRSRVLVATDVAARGLDLAELSLVIHADLPNDRETMLHRSGRTGRAGRKGISILVVPPNRRRRAEELLGRSRINAAWGKVPTAKEIAEKDQERLMAMPILDELATAEDLALGRALLDGRTPEQVAAALIRMHRATLPVPADGRDFGGGAASPGERHAADEPRGASRFSRSNERERPDRARPARNREDADAPREGSGPPRGRLRKEMVLFGLDIGRTKNADVRWLLPMICRVGDVTKSEIGTIKVGDTESRFEIDAKHAARFAETVRTSKNKEGRIWRIDDDAAERDQGAAASASRYSGSHSKPKSRDASAFAAGDAPAFHFGDGSGTAAGGPSENPTSSATPPAADTPAADKPAALAAEQSSHPAEVDNQARKPRNDTRKDDPRSFDALTPAEKLAAHNRRFEKSEAARAPTKQFRRDDTDRDQDRDRPRSNYSGKGYAGKSPGKKDFVGKGYGGSKSFDPRDPNARRSDHAAGKPRTDGGKPYKFKDRDSSSKPFGKPRHERGPKGNYSGARTDLPPRARPGGEGTLKRPGKSKHDR